MRTLSTVAVASALLIAHAGCAPAAQTAAPSDTSSSVDSPTEESPAAEAPDAATPADPTLTDPGPAGSPVMHITADGFDPASLTVSVGDIVEFSTTDDGIYGVTVGTLSSVTVTNGLNEYYEFTEVGTYPVGEEISQASATITVE